MPTEIAHHIGAGKKSGPSPATNRRFNVLEHILAQAEPAAIQQARPPELLRIQELREPSRPLRVEYEWHAEGQFLPDQRLIGPVGIASAIPLDIRTCSCQPSFHLAAIEVITVDGVKFNRAKTFMEVYGTDKTPREWSKLIKEKLEFFNLTLKDIAWVRCDNQIFTPQNDTSKSIADQFIDEDPQWQRVLKPGSKDRVGGWELGKTIQDAEGRPRVLRARRTP